MPTHCCLGGAPEGEVPLRQRRALLMDGLAASLRLSTAPPCENGSAAAAGGAGGKGRKKKAQKPEDGVLRRLLGLRKGRDLLARALALMVPPQVGRRIGCEYTPSFGQSIDNRTTVAPGL